MAVPDPSLLSKILKMKVTQLEGGEGAPLGNARSPLLSPRSWVAGPQGYKKAGGKKQTKTGIGLLGLVYPFTLFE